MALLPEIGNFAKSFGLLLGHYSDPAVRATPGGFQMAVWAAYNEAVQTYPIPPPRIDLQTMNHYVSAIAGIANGSINFGNDGRRVQQTGIDRALEAKHLAPDIDSRPLDQQPLGPNYRIRFQADITIGGLPVEQWFTWEAGIAPPQTVRGVLDALDSAGEAFSQKYGMEYDGLGAQVYITTW